MSPRFERFIPFILSHETAYVRGHYGDDHFVVTERDPNDPGGTTRYGIDFGEHQEPPWRMSESQIDRLTKAQAIDLYWRHWQIDGCEKMPANVGECFFNCATMSGRGQASTILGRTSTAEEFLKDELHVFDLIVEKRPKSKIYLTGWRNRIFDEAKFLKLSIT